MPSSRSNTRFHLLRQRAPLHQNQSSDEDAKPVEQQAVVVVQEVVAPGDGVTQSRWRLGASLDLQSEGKADSPAESVPLQEQEFSNVPRPTRLQAASHRVFDRPHPEWPGLNRSVRMRVERLVLARQTTQPSNRFKRRDRIFMFAGYPKGNATGRENRRHSHAWSAKPSWANLDYLFQVVDTRSVARPPSAEARRV